MADIPGLILELKELTNEIATRSKELTKLRKRKAKIDEQLCKFFDEKKQPGVKYKGVAVIAEDTKATVRKKKSEKEDACISLLKNYNVRDAEKIYKELVDKMKGETVSKKKIKISNVNNI
jgi:regulator of sigma D